MSDISTILSTIQGAVDRLSDSVAIKQEPLFKQLIGMLKTLDTKGDQLLNNINNLKKINQIKVNLEKLIMDAKYKSEVTAFAKSYDEVGDLHNDYFSKFASAHKATKALKILKNTAVESTVNGLTSNGLQVGVTDGVRKILQNNITAGGSYSDLTEQLRKYMITDGKKEGALEQYVKTYATTSLNQYSAEYNKTIADDLGLEWYMYDGSLLETSREFCKKCVKKKYIHVSEFPALLAGDFGSLGDIPLSKTTSLPNGLMAGTDPANFTRRRGGWNCGHQLIAVDEVVVPENVKEAVYATGAYKQWAAKNGKKAEKPRAQPVEEKKSAASTEKTEEVLVEKDAPANEPQASQKVQEIKDNNKKAIQQLEDIKIKFYDDIADHWPADIKLKVTDNGGAFYNPSDNSLTIANTERAKNEYYQKKIMAHEGAHAMHINDEIVTFTKVDEDFATFFANAKKLIAGKESLMEKSLIKLQNQYFSDETKMEQLSILADTLGGLTNGKYGWGHNKSYYGSMNKGKMEVFAHAVTLFKLDNEFSDYNGDFKALTDAMKAYASNLF